MTNKEILNILKKYIKLEKASASNFIYISTLNDSYDHCKKDFAIIKEWLEK